MLNLNDKVVLKNGVKWFDKSIYKIITSIKIEKGIHGKTFYVLDKDSKEFEEDELMLYIDVLSEYSIKELDQAIMIKKIEKSRELKIAFLSLLEEARDNNVTISFENASRTYYSCLEFQTIDYGQNGLNIVIDRRD